MSGGAPTLTPGREDTAQSPGVGAAQVNADGEVVDHAQPHPGAACRLLRVLQLLVADPLQPAVEADPVRQLFPQRFGFGRPQGAVRVGPERVLRRQVLADGGPQRKVVQALAGDPAEFVERRLPRRRAAGVVQQFQGLELGRVDGVAVQPFGVLVQAVDLFLEPVHRGAPARFQVGNFGDGLHPDVERVEEPARGRRVRRGLDRRDGLRGVQRVDQDVVRAAGTAERGQIREVREVADPPGTLGPHGIQLRGQAPAAALQQRRRRW